MAYPSNLLPSILPTHLGEPTKVELQDGFGYEFEGGYTIVTGLLPIGAKINCAMGLWHINHEQHGEIVAYVGPEDQGFEGKDGLIKDWVYEHCELPFLRIAPGDKIEVYTGFYGTVTFEVKSINDQDHALVRVISSEANPPVLVEYQEIPFDGGKNVFFHNPASGERSCLTVYSAKPGYGNYFIEWSTFKRPAFAAAAWLTANTGAKHIDYMVGDNGGPSNVVMLKKGFSSYSEKEWEDSAEAGGNATKMPIKWAKMVPHKEGDLYQICF